MGVSFVVGDGQQPVDGGSFPVRWPLASLRAEAAQLDHFLQRVEPDQPLLVINDCLVLQIILLQWGGINYWPDLEDVRNSGEGRGIPV